MEKKERKRTFWRKLDDQAKVFALASNRKYSSVFRLSAILKENIEKEILQKALEIVLEKYKAYKVKLKKGLFWYYLEENEKNPIISIENESPFTKVNTKRNNNYLFKITYFKNKINIEFFHALTDANSGREFFKKIIYRYLDLKYKEELKDNSLCETKVLQDSENAYKNNYDKTSKKSSFFNSKAYMLKGKKLPIGQIGINHFNINLEEIKKCANEKACTISMYLVAMIAYSIYETNYIKNNGKEEIKICVPINLKKYFETDTLSNFFSYMMVNFDLKKDKKYDFEAILNIVKNEFKEKLNEKYVVETISSDAGMTNNIFIRIVPLIIKKVVARICSLKVKKHVTMTFSNIGRFEIDSKYRKYIEKFLVILSPDWAEKIKCGVCSYENNLVVTFGTVLKENFVENKFKELLEQNNINFNIQNNGVNIIY